MPRSGLVRFKVLPLGISSAFALFQRQMEDLLGEDLIAAGVRVYLDDILMYSKTLDDHLVLLDKVLAKLAEGGLKVRKDKCALSIPPISWDIRFLLKESLSAKTGSKLCWTLQNLQTNLKYVVCLEDW